MGRDLEDARGLAKPADVLGMQMPNLKDEQRDNGSAAGNTGLVAAPTISLPKGGGAIRGIGEKFAANPVALPP
jgi:hypothetical protein